MKIIIVAFLALAFLIPASAQDFPSFTNTEGAIEFLLESIEADDYTVLFNACKNDNMNSDIEHQKHLFELLKDLNQKTPLHELYTNDKFPRKETSFTLGGHGFEWNFLGINFIKENDKWYLNNISQCK